MKTTQHITKITSILFFAISLVACNKSSKDVVKTEDIEPYLSLTKDASIDKLNKNLFFWETKLKANPNQFPFGVKIAGIENQLFSKTGNIQHLKKAEILLKNAVELSGSKQSGYLRALAKNYISQHQFKKALALLRIAEINGDNKQETIKILFDVNIELGNDEMAQKNISNIDDKRSFDYLIRIAKWKDHQGNLGATIAYMEEALQGVKEKDASGLVLWCETNLADYYGHHGDIEKSYQYYLRALEKNPTNIYALKKIAWISFSHDKNIALATYIISQIKKRYIGADVDLLAYEIALYDGDNVEQKFDEYWTEISNIAYGEMYNKYNFDILINRKEYNKAYQLAVREVNNRPTYQSYSLLALATAYYKSAEKAEAIIKEHQVIKSYEPEVLLRVAKVYALSSKKENIKLLKQELLGAEFELGPLKTMEIEKL